MLVELDQVPVIPCRLRHRLVSVIKRGFGKGVTIPFQAGYFTCFATNTRRRIYQFTDLEFPVQTCTRDNADMTGDSNKFCCRLAHSCPYAFSTFTKKPLDSGVCAFGSVTAGVSRFAGVRAFLPSSSPMPRKPW